MSALHVLLFTLFIIALGGWPIAWLLKDATKDTLEEPLKFKHAFLVCALALGVTIPLVNAALGKSGMPAPPGWVLAIAAGVVFWVSCSIFLMLITRVPFRKALLINFKWMVFVAFWYLFTALLGIALESFLGINLKEELFNSAKVFSKTEQ